MLKSGQLIELIIQNLNIFREELKSNAKLGLLNQNVHSENFVAKILNVIYDINLKNLNDKKSNFPGLDLGDEQNQGIAFQITTEKKSSKINETLFTCINQKHYLKFKTIKILIISNKQKNYNIKHKTHPHFSFDPERNILDFDSLFHEIKNLNNDKLQLIYTIVSEELPTVLTKVEKNDFHVGDLPELILDLSSVFRIDLTDEEIEIYLMGLFHLLDTNASAFQKIKINQESFFESRLRDLNKPNKSTLDKKEIVKIKIILNEFKKLKDELDLKMKIFYFTDRFPNTYNYSHLIICLKEIVEKLSFPFFLIEQTAYNEYFELKRPVKADKFKGGIKFDIFKNHESGKQICFSVWLTREEVIEIKKSQSFFNSINVEEFFSSYLYLFTFEALHFNSDTLVKKVIPSFVDSMYFFKNEHQNFIEKDDFSTWTDLTNYNVGLG